MLSRLNCEYKDFQPKELLISGVDVTIIKGKLFREVATIARLKKKDFKAADKKPRTYNRQQFTLDGRMDPDISFGDRTMCTVVYVKMDAEDPILLSEGAGHHAVTHAKLSTEGVVPLV